MTDHFNSTLDHYQGLVDELERQEIGLDDYRIEFSEQLMQEYLCDNHKLSWQVAEWLGDESAQIEGYIFSALTNPDFDMAETWRDWLTEKFEALANSMDSKEIDTYQEEYF